MHPAQKLKEDPKNAPVTHNFIINEKIRSKTIRLIDHEGKNLGVLNTWDAIQKAKSTGLDLVEVSPNENPPVCKILDFGKLLYETKKKEKHNSSRNKFEIKEIRLSVTIADHDLGIKADHARQFIADGCKVQVSLKFHGREMHHPQAGVVVIEKFAKLLEDVARCEHKPIQDGKTMGTIFCAKG